MKAAAKVIASAQEGRPPDSSGVGNAGMEENERVRTYTHAQLFAYLPMLCTPSCVSLQLRLLVSCWLYAKRDC